MSFIAGAHILADPFLIIPVEFPEVARNGKIKARAVIPEDCTLISMECYSDLEPPMHTFTMDINKVVKRGDTFEFTVGFD